MTDISIKIQELKILIEELIFLKEQLASLESDDYGYSILKHEFYKADEKIDNLFADIEKMIEGVQND